MKKVLFVATVQSHIMNFHLPYIDYFLDKGFEVHVCCKMDKKKYSNLSKNIVWKDIDFSRLPVSPSNIKALITMINYMKLNKFSLIHVNTPVAAFIARIAAFFAGAKPVIYTAHGFHFYKGAPILNWLIYYPVEKLGARLSDGIITINEEDYNRAQKFKLRKNAAVYKVNGVGITLRDKTIELYSKSDKAHIRESFGIKSEEFVLIVIAEFVKKKNHIQIIEAVGKMNRHNDIKVLFVGDGELESSLKEEVNKRNLNHVILFLGFRNDVERLISISDAIGLFSYREGLPKSIMEGMIQSKPVIATNVRGSRDLVKNKVNGFLIELNDVEGTAKALEDIINNRELANKLGKNSLEIIENYKLETVMNQMEKIYCDLIKKFNN